MSAAEAAANTFVILVWIFIVIYSSSFLIFVSGVVPFAVITLYHTHPCKFLARFADFKNFKKIQKNFIFRPETETLSTG
jgi:hypothetical protein